jgi:hypothetical protein
MSGKIVSASIRSGSDRNGTSHAQWSRRERADARDRNLDAGGTDPAISAARPCRVPRMRVSRQDATPASPRRSWAGTSGVSRPLEVAGWSPNHRASLFGAAFDNGKAGRPRKSAESRRVDVGSRSGGAAGSGSHHPARAAAWPQTTIGSRGVARTRRRPRRADRGYRRQRHMARRLQPVGNRHGVTGKAYTAVQPASGWERPWSVRAR